MISQSVLRAKIAHEAGKYKSPGDAAKAFGMSRQYLQLILGGEPISNAVAEKFGYRQVERQYVKIRDAK